MGIEVVEEDNHYGHHQVGCQTEEVSYGVSASHLSVKFDEYLVNLLGLHSFYLTFDAIGHSENQSNRNRDKPYSKYWSDWKEDLGKDWVSRILVYLELVSKCVDKACDEKVKRRVKVHKCESYMPWCDFACLTH